MSSPTPAVPSTSSAPPDCGQADARLDYVYGELTGAALASFEKHSASCAECQRDLASFASMRRVMSTLEPEPAPDAGLASLMQFAEQHAARARAPKRAPWMTWVMALVPTAAVAVLALKAVGSFGPTDASRVVMESEHFTAAGSPAAPAAAPSVAPPPPPPERPAPMADAKAVGSLAKADEGGLAKPTDPAAGYGGAPGASHARAMVPLQVAKNESKRAEAPSDGIAPGGMPGAVSGAAMDSSGSRGGMEAIGGVQAGGRAGAGSANQGPAEQKPHETFDELKNRLTDGDTDRAEKKSARKESMGGKADLAKVDAEEERSADKPVSMAKKAKLAKDAREDQGDDRRDTKSKLESASIADDTVAPVAPPAAPKPTVASNAASKPTAHQGMAQPMTPTVAAAPTPDPAPVAQPSAAEPQRVVSELASGSAESRQARDEASQAEQVITLYRNASYARADKNQRKAAQLFHQAYEAAPTGPRAADALLQAGLSEEASGQHAEAQGTYARLVREFPSSREASAANGRLDSLRQRASDRPAPAPRAASPAKSMDFQSETAK